VDRADRTVRDDLAQAPDLFRGAAVSTDWPAHLRAARAKLDNARSEDRELQYLDRENRAESQARAEWLLNGERTLRESAVRDSDAVVASAGKWINFRKNVPGLLDDMKREYDAIRAVDLTSTAKAVDKAEQDWPAKKTALDSRLTTLQATPAEATKKWTDTEALRKTAAAGKATGPQLATLIQTDDFLTQTATDLPKEADELRGQAGQLYNAWDKVLADLDVSHSGGQTVYREKLKTVTTHYTDVADKKADVSSDEKWVDVPQPQYAAVENDLGMTIAHKDAGQFDSEATNVPQPPGFAYMAPPSQGSNQYGYWRNDGGHSVWTWLPEYLIMRDLLWGHGGYRPVIVDEYNGYRTAQQYGRTYYGQTTPAAPPKYGSHGTFTAEHYSSSRYISSGGFKSSRFANHPSATPGIGRGFGHSEPEVGSSPGGRRFGSPGGSGFGRRFGASPSPGRRFGGGGFGGGRGFGRRR